MSKFIDESWERINDDSSNRLEYIKKLNVNSTYKYISLE